MPGSLTRLTCPSSKSSRRSGSGAWTDYHSGWRDGLAIAVTVSSYTNRRYRFTWTRSGVAASDETGPYPAR